MKDRKAHWLLLGVAMFAAACSGGGDSGGGGSEVRVFHASPDAPNVDVEVDGQGVLQDVPYGAASAFLAVDSGARRFTVKAAGTDTAVIDAVAELAHEKRYLVTAAGKVSEIAPIISAVETARPASGNARLRVIHSAASAPAVDVYFTAPNAGFGTGSEVPSFVGLAFRGVSNYVEVPAGTYDVYVTISGTQDVAIEAKGVSLAEGFTGSAAALDKKGGGAPFSIALLDER